MKKLIAILSLCAILVMPAARLSAAGPVEAQPFSSQEMAELQVQEAETGDDVAEIQAGNLGTLLSLALVAVGIYLTYELVTDDE